MSNTLFFDVETPNRHQDRICQLGIICDDSNGETIFKRSYYINPETTFDDMNMSIHHIKPSDVANAPTFPSVWEEVKSYFQSSLLVAHNASFDLSVLDKTLSFYNIDFSVADYVDTKAEASALPGLIDCKLDSICQYFNLPLEHHHNALDDTEACRNIYLQIKKSRFCTVGLLIS